jgi:hypothetical protein
MKISVSYTLSFDRRFKKYAKKFQSLKADLKLFINDLDKTKAVDLGGNLYKYRLSVKSKNKGKSGGFRVITFELIVSDHEKNVTLLALYDKSEQGTLTKSQIEAILKSEGLV